MDDNSVLMWIAGQIIVAAAIWGGIRADISNMHKRIDRFEARLDNHIDAGKKKSWLW